MNVHPPPPTRTGEDGFIFLYSSLVFPKKNVLKGKPDYFGVIQVKRPQNVFFSSHLLKPNFNNVNILR